MVKIMKEKQAFSLVEILVALIIVSVIMAAMAPAITKKLASSGITIAGGGSGGSGIVNPEDTNPSGCGTGSFMPTGEEECKSCLAVTPYCLACQDGEGKCTKCDNEHTLTPDGKCKENSLCGEKTVEIEIAGEKYCMTKYNIGSSAATEGFEIDVPTGTVTMVQADGTTSCSGKCCWKGTTASAYNSSHSEYSGKYHTVCNKAAGIAACSNLVLNGYSDWFLPNVTQLRSIDIKKYSFDLGNDGLQFCYQGEIEGANKCETRMGYCKGSVSNGCWPSHYWSSDGYWSYINNAAGAWNGNSGDATHAMSIRCMRKIGVNDAATACEPGTFKTSNTCKECRAKTPNCRNCNSSTGICTVCDDGYELSGTKCVPNGCGAHSIKVDIKGVKYCMTKYNIGDKGLAIPDEEVKIVPAGGTTSCSGKCCWQGKTAAECDDNAYANSYNSSDKYSTCTRTVCTHSAALSICDNLIYDGFDDWTLPTNSQYTSINLSEYLFDKTFNGLMYCDSTANKNQPHCQPITGNCKGSISNGCWPNHFWSKERYYWCYDANALGCGVQGDAAHAMSVRCIRKVKDIEGATNCKFGEYLSSGACTACSTKTANCQYCNMETGACTVCKDGYSLVGSVCKPTGCGEHAIKVAINGSNYCVMKYNAGDGGVSITGNMVKLAIAGTGADATSCSTNCCWQGKTSNNCDANFSPYNSCTRTVCDFQGAINACDNLVYMGYDNWRLLTNSEFNALDYSQYSIGQHNEGLMFCDEASANNSPTCSSGTCSGAQSNSCYPTYNWTRDGYGFFLNSNNKNSNSYTSYPAHAFSARCARKMDATEGLTNCNKGEYLSSDACVSCETKTPNCIKCNTTTGACLACREGYELNGSNCVLTGCGAKAVKVTINNQKYCLTKYNIGDGGIPIPSGSATTAIVGGTSCSGKCCWKNKTANYCDDYNDTYSSCNRTLCNYPAASSICDNLIYNGYDDWSLVTDSQLSGLNVSTYSLGKGQDGLQFCSDSAGYESSRCSSTSGCNGSVSNGCWPSHFWVSGGYYKQFEPNAFKSAVAANSGDALKHAFSVRCIRKIGENEEVAVCSNGNYLNGSNCEACALKTTHCQNCNSNTGICTLCEDGYELDATNQCKETGCGAKAVKLVIDNQEYCMTKVNIGYTTVNEYEIPIPAAAGVSVATAGASAADGGSCSGKCCWAGTTASTCTSATAYSGCTRTVCNFPAAQAICDNLVYNGYDDWSLLSNYQINSIDFTEYSVNKGTDGLMMCDGSVNQGYSQCASSSKCLGSVSSGCWPNHFWSNQAYYFYMSNSKIGGQINASSTDAQKHAFSVRCIRKKT